MKYIFFVLIPFFLFSFKGKYEEKDIFNNFLIEVYNLNYDKATEKALSIKNEELKILCLDLVKIKFYAGQKRFTLKNVIIPKKNDTKIIYLISRGYYYLYTTPYDIKSFELFSEAYVLAKKNKNTLLLRLTLVAILDVYYNEIYKSNNECLFYLNELKKNSLIPADNYYYYLHFIHLKLRSVTDNVNLNKGFLKSFSKIMSNFDENHPFYADYYSSLGILLKLDNKTNESRIMFQKAINISKKHFYLEHILFRSHIHLSELYRKNNNYLESEKQLDHAAKYINDSDSLSSEYYLNIYKSFIYYDRKKYRRAYDYLKESSIQLAKLDYKNNISEIAKLDKKYKTAEKEKEILIERQNNKQNRNLLIGSVLFIALGGTIATLTLQNSKRKRKLAEQQKALETQKNLTLIKEQEITTINAMVDGQEKERKRIAEDLHDNLGSVLATLKLHFENLKINKNKKKIDQDKLFDKTENLIDEAYLKVRRIAHSKNAGVIANQGLLVAIQMMAKKISSADKIHIEVIDYGLDKRLENSLEITVFRIIQELITNIIKHANATKASINISLYDKNLNVIVEDNGTGFNASKIKSENGIGINSIKTRIKHLKGSFTVDSTIGKGSSIIIDIPIT
ncbi:sensor histidine kinase [uncultured Polaribacter sp.]|uniref:ATP-binding protein n=1 Tax=uncultured Polaribacter sp. TaxID=174711 RepID=UPI00259B47E2|nr:sensor histidine kinase [uncultured Polaribacter sp.]